MLFYAYDCYFILKSSRKMNLFLASIDSITLPTA